MADLVQFELVTPEQLVVSTMVEMVVVPGTEGNFGVLPGHAPLISTIRPGMIEIYENRVVTERIFIVSGIAEVTPERCTVLAEEAMSPSTLDRGAIEAELQIVEGNLPSLRDQVARATGAERDGLVVELRGLEHQQAVARAKLQALATLAH
jgi:F-type H+-transporting ATPase subunit epsilon